MKKLVLITASLTALVVAEQVGEMVMHHRVQKTFAEMGQLVHYAAEEAVIEWMTGDIDTQTFGDVLKETVSKIAKEF